MKFFSRKKDSAGTSILGLNTPPPLEPQPTAQEPEAPVPVPEIVTPEAPITDARATEAPAPLPLAVPEQPAELIQPEIVTAPDPEPVFALKPAPISEPEPEPEEEAPKTGFFGRMKAAVTRTRESFSSRIENIVALTRTVDESALEDLEAALLTSDIGVPTTTEILNALRERAKHQAIEGGAELRALLKEQIQSILESPVKPIAAPAAPPRVTFLVGVNGAGKTTTSGKLAAWYRAQGRTAILCAADTFRAAAIEQLEVWATRSGVEIIKTRQGGDPAAVLYDAAAAAKARKIDELIVDTAGRLHTKTGLMDELTKMRRTADKLIPGAPHEVLLVIDATTGQNGLQQARLFTQAAGVTGIMLTKLDGTAKGGIAVAIARELNLPVRFAGVGEKMGDLLEFSPKDFATSLLGD